MGVVAGTVAPLVVGLAVLGGLGSFATVRGMAGPYFGDLAWIVPVGMDLGILVLLTWDLLMEYLGLPWPVLRWVAWAYIAGTVMVNVAAAQGDLAGSVMHAAMPVLFVTVVEGVRHLIRWWAGLAAGDRVERVPRMRWILAPLSSLSLWRRMVLWHVTSYQQGLELEQRHLMAVSRLQEEHGRWRWRWRASLAERLALRLPPGGANAPRDQGSVPDRADSRDSEERNAESSHARQDELMAAARSLLDEADREGVRLSRDRLGKRLRELGFTVGNGRLAEINSALRREPTESN
ncbi:DUF2637 domain-containing protein [Actinomadura xylanilytica]|uniref:DUF2637 domain-containing protein n=1 Tax=Actinomadura xylanilytica TaxID=887459 RepID=UPI00255B3721|nr:DUF2637 domain-containing protein [Actinomadura xylanilytica]MDL4770710.1 DUF2637 domain-containing protein [Actinomadura xylanilytica]